jgi:hypothetical protein
MDEEEGEEGEGGESGMKVGGGWRTRKRTG